MSKDAPEKSERTPITPLQATVELLKQGHREFLPRLREQLAQQPDVWRYCGDLARQARHTWIELIAGPNDLLRESAELFVDEMFNEVAGSDPSPLERLLAESPVELKVSDGDFASLLYSVAEEGEA